MLIAMAVFASFCSLASGLLAVGNGSHYEYAVRDLILGRKDAVIYLWVALSTAFALMHFGTLLGYGLEQGWVVEADRVKWMWLHTGLATFLASAHLLARNAVIEPHKRRVYLWGPLKNHVAD